VYRVLIGDNGGPLNTRWEAKQKSDPAERAGQMLFRIGFATLVILLPLSAALSRRGPVIVAPIGCIILILAAFITRDDAYVFQKAKSLLLRPIGLVAMAILGWALLSLVWTPFPGNAAERLFRIYGTAAITLGAVAMLPDRMRTSNLYLIAFGAGVNIILIMALLLAQPVQVNTVTVERGTIFVTLLAWPAVTYLSLKKRSLESMAIAGSVGAIILMLKGPIILPSLLVGAVVLGGALNNRRAATISLFAGIVFTIMAAPVWAIILSLFPIQEDGLARLMQIWADVITKDPIRLLTGHGMDSALRNKISPLLEVSAPKSLLFEVWYELGLIGALCLSAFLILCVERVSQLGNHVAPFALGAFGFAFALSVTGLGTSQTWWLTALSMTIIAFAAVANRENSVERPVALFATETKS
jgi:hypothetical protein